MIQVSYVPNNPWKTELHLYEDTKKTTLVDLTGATFRMMVRSHVDSEIILAEASSDNNKITIELITIGDVTGIGIKISLTKEETLAMYQAGINAFSDLEITFPNEDPIPKAVEFVFTADKVNTRDF